MAKTITQRLIEKQKKAHGSRKNLADFLANREQILIALNQGFSARAVWELLHEDGNITFNYNTFCRYLKKFSSQTVVSSPNKIDQAADKETSQKDVIPSKVQTKSQGFTFNPNADKKDLV